MAETLKTPKDLRVKKPRAKKELGDDYSEYMQAVLRQASAFPDKPSNVSTH